MTSSESPLPGPPAETPHTLGLVPESFFAVVLRRSRYVAAIGLSAYLFLPHRVAHGRARGGICRGVAFGVG